MLAAPFRSGVVVLLWFFPLIAAGLDKAPAIVSNSQITITGAGFQRQTVNLPAVTGDWFASSADAHANLDLATAPGAPRIVMQLQWDGRGSSHTVTHDNNDTVVGTGHSTFYLILPEGAASPHDSDTIIITVTHMDDNTLDAHIEGTATATGKVRFSGTISLRRTGTHVVGSSGGWHNCDPQIHDKMVGAENRSPSECEVKFDQHVRQVFQQAFGPAVSTFSGEDWTVAKQPNLGPVTAIARHSENAPYRIDLAHDGAFHLELALSPNSPVYQRFAQAYQQQMEKMTQQVADASKNGGAANQQAIDQLAQTLSAQADNTAIKISAVTNRASAGVVNFKTTHTTEALPGGGTVIFIPGAQAPTGGGADAAEAVTWVLIGSWGAPAAKPLGSDGEHIDVNGGLQPGHAKLAVQNVFVRIRASRELAQKVIQRIDWNAIRALLQEN